MLPTTAATGVGKLACSFSAVARSVVVVSAHATRVGVCEGDNASFLAGRLSRLTGIVVAHWAEGLLSFLGIPTIKAYSIQFLPG